MRDKLQRRQFARYKALDDVIKLLMYNMRDGTGVQFAFFSNQYADPRDIELYHQELIKIGDQLARRQEKLHKELF